MVGVGKGAEVGILFKNSTALEQAQKLTAIVLDKTGTITRGQPSVTDVVVSNDASLAQNDLVAPGSLGRTGFGASVGRIDCAGRARSWVGVELNLPPLTALPVTALPLKSMGTRFCWAICG